MAGLSRQLTPQEQCQLFGHRWDHGVPPPPDWTSNSYGTALFLRCEMCGSYRVDCVNFRGELMWRHYYRPDTWITYPKGERPKANKLRKEWRGMYQ